MRISYWSSDVCSSDLIAFGSDTRLPESGLTHCPFTANFTPPAPSNKRPRCASSGIATVYAELPNDNFHEEPSKSEEPCGGKELVSKCRPRGSPSLKKKQYTTNKRQQN